MPLKPHAMRGLLVEATAAHVQQTEKQQLAAELAETRRLLAERDRQLADLQASTQQIVDHLSHDFRTPLTVIQEFTSLVREGLAGEVNGQQEAYLDIVADRADDLAMMADELLDAQKLKAGTLRIWRKPCRVSDIISPLRANLERKARVKGIRLEWAIETDLPHVYCDPDKIGRAVCTLVAHAIKTSKRGTSVEIWGAAGGSTSEILLGVTDEGAGLDCEVVSQLLDRFRQPALHPHNEQHQRQLTANSLVRLNLGEMFVESSAGEGTTFWFSLPIAQPLAIAKRHFEVLAQQDLPEIEVSLVEISIADAAGPCDMTPVIDEFLQQQQSADDLVMVAGPGRWFFLLRVPVAEIQQRCDRLAQQWLGEQHETPVEELPKLACNVMGSWNLTTTNWKPTRGTILRHFTMLKFAECDQEPSPLMLIV